VTGLLNTPARRITVAIVLSVLVHAAILWLPDFRFRRATIELPPLSVRLEPRPHTQPADKSRPADPEPASPLTKPDRSSPARSSSNALAAMSKSAETIAPHPFPSHLQLTFSVYQGEGGPRSGEIRQRLDIHGNRYTLTSQRQTAGLASLRNSDRIIQTSTGKIVEHGLQPDTFDETRITGNGRQVVQATFDREAQLLHLDDGSETPLPGDAQDALSFMYQISQLPLQGEFFAVPVSDGTQLQQYQIEIGTRQDLATPLGKLRVLHLRRMHEQGAAYFEIWLGMQYRMLPVKFRLVDSADRVIEEYLISDIRAGDK
jgi:hypothetical protein